MEFIISFFRDKVVGWWYLLYILACLFFILVVIGVYGDNKRSAIAARLKEKKARDIASGKEARIAALESKQVLDVMEEESADSVSTGNPETVSSNDTENLAKKEEAPPVLVIGADGNSNEANPPLQSEPAQVAQPVVVEQTSAQSSSVQQGAVTQQPIVVSADNASQS